MAAMPRERRAPSLDGDSGANIANADHGKSLLSIAAVGGVLFLTIINLLLAPQTELIPEEAYYWTYSQHPALSYFDHPPMVAWIIWLGTAVFGNTELGVRIVAIALWPVSAWLLFLTGRLWFGREAAERAVLLFCLTPIYVAFGFIVTPDAPLIFFWLLTLYATSKALQSGQGAFWLLAGLGLGCAMLSKYTAVMLAGSLFIFLVSSAHYRYWLRRIEPWLALLLGIAVFSPVLVWNSQHQWASFIFQTTRTVVVEHSALTEAGTFWLYQLLALTPFLFALYAYALVPAAKRAWIYREDRWNFAMSFALPLFIIFVLASFKNKGHVNWTAPVYLSWSLAAAVIFTEIRIVWQRQRAGLWRLLIGASVALSVTGISIAHASLAWGFPFAFSNAGAWRSLAREAGNARAELARSTGKPVFIIGGDKLNSAAEVGFYLHDTVDVVNDYALGGSGIGYRYWVDLKQFEGRPAIVVLPKIKKNTVQQLKSRFAQVDEPMLVQVDGNGKKRRIAYLVRCQGYIPAH
jgi:dolichol-phosphate mannosyltransferase